MEYLQYLDLGWLDVVELVGYLCLPVFLVVDLIWRDRVFETTTHWRGRSAIITLGNFYLGGYVAMFWGSVFAGKSLLLGSKLGVVGGAVAGILLYELLHYGYHRLIHTWNPLWRFTHQMHHAAESVDAFGAFYIHPLDSALFTTLASIVLFPVLGLSMEAGLVANTFLMFNAVFQHANIRTPYWLGYFIQRPESHRIHHARGVHSYNYSDLPLWDMVFGTFRNPKSENITAGGFYKDGSLRVWDMLLFRDISGPKSSDRKAATAMPVKARELIASLPA